MRIVVQRKRWWLTTQRQMCLLLIGTLVLLFISPLSLQSATRSAPVGQVQEPCLQPPRNINVSALTDMQLVAYGLPSRAALTSNPARWSYLLAHAQHRTCGTHTLIEPRSAPTACFNGSICGTVNWAGAIATGGWGTYRAAETQFTIPRINTTDRRVHVSLWAGVGGWSSGAAGARTVVVQTGVDISVNSYGQQVNTSWWEVAPNMPEQALPLSRLHVGDTIIAYAESNLNNSGYDYFWIQNVSNGANDYNSVYVRSAVNFSDGATSECIVERVSGGGGYLYPLARFSQPNLGANAVGMTNCRTRQNGQSALTNIGAFPHISAQIYQQGSGIPLATIGPLFGGNAFTVTWHGAY